DDLAASSRRLLSAHRSGMGLLARTSRLNADRKHHVAGNLAETQAALSPGWVALVSGHTGAGDWPGAGGRSGPRGSIHVCAVDRSVCHDRLERRGACPPRPPASACRGGSDGRGTRRLRRLDLVASALLEG